MGIIHIVTFSFKELVPPEEIQTFCSEMLAVKDKCIHPETKKPYIKSATGGIDNSTEGLQDGATHVLVVEFENEEDRKYYLEHDPEHKAFKAGALALAGKLRIVDFTPGVF